MQAKRLLILIKLAESPQYIFPDYKIAASLSNGLLAKSMVIFTCFFQKIHTPQMAFDAFLCFY